MTFFKYWRKNAMMTAHLILLALQLLALLVIYTMVKIEFLLGLFSAGQLIIVALAVIGYRHHVKYQRLLVERSVREVSSLFPGSVSRVVYRPNDSNNPGHSLIEVWSELEDYDAYDAYTIYRIGHLIVANTYWVHMGDLPAGSLLINLTTPQGKTLISQTLDAVDDKARAAVNVLDLNPSLAEKYVERTP